MSQRSMVGVRDFTGHEIGTLKIEAMVQRHPPRYSCSCKRCGAKQTIAQRDLSTGAAICRASGCGMEAAREAAEMTPRKYQLQQERIKQNRIDAIAREVKDKADKIARLQQERMLKGVDADFPYDPEARDMRCSAQEAAAYNALEARQFLAANPWYHSTPGNLQLIAGYLDRHGIVLVSATQLELVARRLDEFGLLERRPEPTPAPVVNLSIDRSSEPPKKPEPEVYEGWDEQGQPRVYSAWEVNHMTGDQMKRRLRLTPSKLALPTHAAF